MDATSHREQLLHRAAALIRLSSSRDRTPEVTESGHALRCCVTGAEFSYRDGILDLLPDDGPKTFSQHVLDTRLTAWAYDGVRESLMRLGGVPNFRTEVANILRHLQLQSGDVVIDLACGQGNFTMEWSRQVGDEGIVIGLDISRPMLRRAAARVAAARATNVLLIHGSALDLPIASSSVRRVNCSGGFHVLPDLPRALREIARVSASGAVLTASMFAEDPRHQRPRLREWLRNTFGLHFVPLAWLGEELAASGYGQYAWSIPRAAFGYASAVKADAS